IQYWQPVDEPQQVFSKGVRDINDGDVPESVVNHARQAGAFRSVLLQDHVSPAFYRSEHFEALYTRRGYSDSLFVVAPVNDDVEAYYCFYRGLEDSPFNDQDRQTAAFALRGLKWFQRQVMLDHGLLVAEQPLSPVERRILRYLLTDQSEQQIAEHMGQSPATTHKYVTTLYRKFNVSGRAGLAALWLGH
ncbi:MAG TPA: LuxR C-terminal-related transcriptional regulator, partial [Pseudomonadales bacterium]